MSRVSAVFAALAAATVFVAQLAAAPPDKDARNELTPHTDTVAAMPDYRTKGAWQARRARLRTQVLAAAGLLPLPERTPLNPQIFGRLERDGYTVEKVLLETWPGFYLGGNLYRPRAAGRHPAVLKAHGHWSYGRLEHQPLAEQQTLCANLAQQGYVVFNYDMVGYDDTVQVPHAFGGPREELWSFGPFGLQLWNSIRALDFVESLDSVDPERIGMTGASGGGTQTFALYAVDDRVRCAAPVNMISARMQGGDACENAPGLRVGTSNVEIGALMAPRPLLMVSASGDWTTHTPEEEFPAIRRIFALYGRPEDVSNAHFDAPHNFHKGSREAVYQFFARHLGGRTGEEAVPEKEIEPERLQDVLALHGRSLPEGALTYEGLFAAWREASQRQTKAAGDRALLRQHLATSMGVEWPERVLAAGPKLAAGELVLGRPDRGDRVIGTFAPGKGRPALVLHPEGGEGARRSQAVKRLKAAERPVMTIDAFQTGAARVARDRSHRYFLTFNRSDDACRLQDVLTALSYLTGLGQGSVEVIGLERAALWALFGAALAPGGVELGGEAPASVDLTDDDLVREFFVPGLQRGGGVAAALRLAIRSESPRRR